MGAATELRRKIADPKNPNLFAVLFPKKGHGTRLHRLLAPHDVRLNQVIDSDLLVDYAFDVVALVRGHRLKMRKIKPEALCRDLRAFLGDMVTEERS